MYNPLKTRLKALPIQKLWVQSSRRPVYIFLRFLIVLFTSRYDYFRNFGLHALVALLYVERQLVSYTVWVCSYHTILEGLGKALFYSWKSEVDPEQSLFYFMCNIYPSLQPYRMVVSAVGLFIWLYAFWFFGQPFPLTVSGQRYSIIITWGRFLYKNKVFVSNSLNIFYRTYSPCYQSSWRYGRHHDGNFIWLWCCQLSLLLLELFPSRSYRRWYSLYTEKAAEHSKCNCIEEKANRNGFYFIRFLVFWQSSNWHRSISLFASFVASSSFCDIVSSAKFFPKEFMVKN